MAKRSELSILIIILLFGSLLRLFNLMHDSPFFFDPDERNMAIAITQLRLPSDFSRIIPCIYSQFASGSTQPAADDQSPQADNCNLNPHFFAYGQFPLYLSFASDQIVRSIHLIPFRRLQAESPGLSTDFSGAVFWLRFYSALASILTIYVIYKISLLFLHKKMALLGSFLVAFCPGLIQSAHFGTTESILTFLFMISVYFSLKLVHFPAKINDGKNKTPVHLLILGIALTVGLALASKLTGLFFLIPPFLTLLIRFIKDTGFKFKKIISQLPSYVFLAFLLLSGTVIFSVLFSPYNAADPRDFQSAVFGYESDVATGRYPAFYTRQFVNSVPVLFQTEKIFPYSLGWPVFILGTIGFLLILIQHVNLSIQYFVIRINRIKKKHGWYEKIFKLAGDTKEGPAHVLHAPFSTALKQCMGYLSGRTRALNTALIIIILSFLSYLLPNAFLFAKWTRFMTPTLPFFALFAAYLISKFENYKFRNFHIDNLIIGSILFISALPGIAYLSVYVKPDSRIQATQWIYRNIPDNSYILSETANVVDIPLGLPQENIFNPHRYEVISFDFYNLDGSPLLFQQLLTHLSSASYIFIPSRRIFANYPRLPKEFPLVTKYYQLLFSGRLGFEKVGEISSYPGLNLGPLRWQFPDENAEETFTVFDHPVIRIYKKVGNLKREDYQQLFEN